MGHTGPARASVMLTLYLTFIPESIGRIVVFMKLPTRGRDHVPEGSRESLGSVVAGVIMRAGNVREANACVVYGVGGEGA